MSEGKRNTIKTHKDLNVWKESMDLVVEIYEMTYNFPDYEKFGLSSQVKKSATKEFIRYLYISLGFLSELETQLIIAHKLNYVSNDIYDNLNKAIEILRKKLINLIKYQKRYQKNDP